MAIQEFFTSRNNGIGNGAAYVGQDGRLWYDPGTNTIRVSDGNTPGGTIVSGGGGGGGNPIEVDFNGNLVTANVTLFDFTGSGVTISNIGNAVTVNIPGGVGQANIPVANSNITITNAVSSFNFQGSGISANAIGNAVTVTVPGAGYITFDGGSPYQDYTGGPAFDCGGVI
jgi:hypothetical protein